MSIKDLEVIIIIKFGDGTEPIIMALHNLFISVLFGLEFWIMEFYSLGFSSRE